MLLAVSCCAALVLFGCVHTSGVTARTLDQGRTSIDTEAGAYLLPASDPEVRGPTVFPSVKVGIRHGLTDRLEVGANASLGSVGAMGKIGILRSAANGGVDLSLLVDAALAFPPDWWGPGGRGGFLDTAKPQLFAEAGIPLGVNFGAGWEVTVVPRVMGFHLEDDNPRLEDVTGWAVRGSASVAIPLFSFKRPGMRILLIPEIFMTKVIASKGALRETDSPNFQNGVTASFAFGT